MSQLPVSPRRFARAAVGCAAALALLAIPSPATAASIGTDATAVGAFSYDVDAFLGPIFTVENFVDSPGSFSSIVVRLFQGTTDVLDLSLGDVAQSSLAQSTDDLTSVFFDSAVLTLSFSMPGTVTTDALTALTFDPGSFTGSTATTAIDFTPEQTQNVPEPSTLLLLASGAGIACTRRRSRTVP